MGLEKVEALQNLVVLDLTRVVAGPYAGSILGAVSYTHLRAHET